MNLCKEHQNNCSSMQQKAANQVGLEDEILTKVDEQYSYLKSIIDEQKENAKSIIRNLESVQSYRPPPQNITGETLTELNTFASSVEQQIGAMRAFISKSDFLEILKQRKMIEESHSQLNQLKVKINQHNSFF